MRWTRYTLTLVTIISTVKAGGVPQYPPGWAFGLPPGQVPPGTLPGGYPPHSIDYGYGQQKPPKIPLAPPENATTPGQPFPVPGNGHTGGTAPGGHGTQPQQPGQWGQYKPKPGGPSQFQLPGWNLGGYPQVPGGYYPWSQKPPKPYQPTNVTGTDTGGHQPGATNGQVGPDRGRVPDTQNGGRLPDQTNGRVTPTHQPQPYWPSPWGAPGQHKPKPPAPAPGSHGWVAPGQAPGGYPQYGTQQHYPYYGGWPFQQPPAGGLVGPGSGTGGYGQPKQKPITTVPISPPGGVPGTGGTAPGVGGGTVPGGPPWFYPGGEGYFRPSGSTGYPQHFPGQQYPFYGQSKPKPHEGVPGSGTTPGTGTVPGAGGGTAPGGSPWVYPGGGHFRPSGPTGYPQQFPGLQYPFYGQSKPKPHEGIPGSGTTPGTGTVPGAGTGTVPGAGTGTVPGAGTGAFPGTGTGGTYPSQPWTYPGGIQQPSVPVKPPKSLYPGTGGGTTYPQYQTFGQPGPGTGQPAPVPGYTYPGYGYPQYQYPGYGYPQYQYPGYGYPQYQYPGYKDKSGSQYG